MRASGCAIPVLARSRHVPVQVRLVLDDVSASADSGLSIVVGSENRGGSRSTRWSSGASGSSVGCVSSIGSLVGGVDATAVATGKTAAAAIVANAARCSRAVLDICFLLNAAEIHAGVSARPADRPLTRRECLSGAVQAGDVRWTAQRTPIGQISRRLTSSAIAASSSSSDRRPGCSGPCAADADTSAR